ncbi:cobalt transporter [Rhizobium sp. CG5]|uniref:energy-coupling factor ABC transporter permease n=1 Tax=Rhizobium sp. CG5 TaxID=2726076 RepID=UPI0020333DD9|nr:energy-coupling factor ABC transporter permease [Rhizobium sp. CG5]MCM2477572.1 cobalt transporter [Rhizobium sp. CG5]
MHIEPSVVDDAKIVLSYVTALGAFGGAAKMSYDTVRVSGAVPYAMRSAIATALVFFFFEVLPHHPVGVSEVHLILGSTLLLLFGAGPAAVGLSLGLLLQGIFFAPFDLPQYGMNVTTLLVPLFAINQIAKRLIPQETPYVEVTYRQTLALSSAYQGGIVLWVAFWALYGQGFTAANLANVTMFGAAYMSVVVVEPLLDLAVLAMAKSLRKFTEGPAFVSRLHSAA